MLLLRTRIVPLFVTTYLIMVAYFHGQFFPDESKLSEQISVRLLRELETTSDMNAVMLSKYARYMAISKKRIIGVEDKLKKLETASSREVKNTLGKLDYFLNYIESQLDANNSTIDEASISSDEFWNAHPLSSSTNVPRKETWLLGKIPNTNKSSIPKNIYKVYIQKSGGYQKLSELPINIMTAHQSWKSQNPGYEVHYFDMILARRYLAKYFNPVFLRAFDCIEAFAGKTNLIRLAIIYREGGWYSDWKQVCMQEKLLDKLSAWKAEEGVFFRSKWGEEKGQRLSTQNAFFGAAPKNPVVEKALGKLLENVQGEYYGNFPTQATGTGVFGWAFQMVKKRRQREYKSPISPAGFFDDSNYFYVNDTAVVLHKCENCGNSRGSWHHGNDYIKLYNDKQYYCQAAPSIFAF